MFISTYLLSFNSTSFCNDSIFFAKRTFALVISLFFITNLCKCCTYKITTRFTIDLTLFYVLKNYIKF